MMFQSPMPSVQALTVGPFRLVVAIVPATQLAPSLAGRTPGNHG